MPYGTFITLTSDSMGGGGVGQSRLTYDRNYTVSSSNEKQVYLYRAGSNSYTSVRNASKPSRRIIGWKLIRYRDKKAKKVFESKTYKRRIKILDMVQITYRDRSKPGRLIKIYKRGKLLRTYRKFPLVTKMVPHITWKTVTFTIKRMKFPLVVKNVPIYAPKKARFPQCTMRTPSLVPNNLTYNSARILFRQSSGRTTGYDRQNPTVVCGISGDLWSSTLYSYTRLRAIGTLAPDFTLPPIVPSSYQSAINDCDYKALNRLYDGVANCGPNCLVALGTAGQTAQFIASNIVRIASILRAVRQGDLRTLSGMIGSSIRPKSISDLWLEVQYALRPLLSDVNAAIEQFDKNSDLTFDVIRTATLNGITKNSSTYRNDMPTFSDSVQTAWKVTVRYKARLRVDNAGLRALAQMGMTNPSVLAWEVIPFSFVIDWLLPIGNALNRLSALDGIYVESWHRTVFIRESILFTRTFGGIDYNNRYVWNSGSASAGIEKIYVNRSVQTGNLPKPPLPRMKNPFSSEHTANALALLTSFRRN